MLLKDICPSFSCPSCKKLLNFFDLRTFVAKFCRENLRTFSADFFDLKSKICRHLYFFWDVCLYVFARQLFLYRRYKKVLLFRFGLVLYPSNSSHPPPARASPRGQTRPQHGSSDGTASHIATVHLITIRCVFGGSHCVA